MTTDDVTGVLPVDKPAGPTSHDMVALGRRALRTRRIGHTGTLDPFASGLLLLCIGTATRLAEYLTGLDKGYFATVRLGATTDTDDVTGAVLAERDVADVDRQAIAAALADMTGEVLQRPPAYSAKKVAGERAYAAARAGRALELEPVRVRIDDLRVISYHAPHLELEVACGSGTYIRAIARDLGEALGVGAHLTSLRRTRIGGFAVDDAVPAGDLGDAERVGAALLTPAAALGHLPHVELDDTRVVDLRHGRAVPVDALRGDHEAVVVTAAGTGELIAVAACAGGVLRPKKVFV